MREQSMFCKLKKLLGLALSVSFISLMTTQNLCAQNVTLEPENTPQLSSGAETDFLGVSTDIPDELSLPSELPAPQALPISNESTNNGVARIETITPEGDKVVSIEGGDVLDLNTPQPIADGLQLPTTDGVVPLANNNSGATNEGLPLIDTSANAPLEGQNINMPTVTPDVSMNVDMPLTGPNAVSVEGAILPEANENIDVADVDNLGEGLLEKIDNKLFSQMSDLEKQTALLTLELRREKIKNEIAAIKAQRLKALEEEEAKKEEKERKRIEWEKEQEAKVLQEKQAVIEAQAKLEKLRQEKVLRAYKESMLKEKQEWIKNNAKLYEQIKNIEKDRKNLVDGLRNKMIHVSSLATKAQQEAAIARDNYKREIKNMQSQISILKSRLEAALAEQKAEKMNPFAQPEVTVAETEEELPRLVEEYAIMEVRGQGDELTAKLINRDGDTFMVREGTTLQTGHKIDEITKTHVRAEINGIKDYLYFAAGGILDKEPEKSDLSGKKNNPNPARRGANSEVKETTMINRGVPSLGSSMFVR